MSWVNFLIVKNAYENAYENYPFHLGVLLPPTHVQLTQIRGMCKIFRFSHDLRIFGVKF